jgi:2-oxoglutarate ferredoxin oxidoreductase subunit alpha
MATKPAQGDVMQARWGTHGDHGIIVLCPSSVQECYELTIEAFNLSEAFRIPVVLLGDEIIGHLKEKLEVMEPEEIKIINRKQPTGPLSEYKPYDHQNGIAPLANYGGDYLLRVTGSMHDAKGHANNNPQMAENYIRHLSDKVETNKETIVITKKHGLEDAECVIVGYGCTARSALAAMETGRKRGLKIGVLQLVTLWPFPEKEVQEVLSQAKQIIVPELNLGQVVSEVKKLNQWQTQIVAVNRVDGKNIHPDEILSAIGEARHV